MSTRWLRLAKEHSTHRVLPTTQRVFACLRHLRDAPYWLQTVTTIGLPAFSPRLPLSVPGMVAVLPGAAGTVPEVLVCVRFHEPPSTVLCQLTALSWYTYVTLLLEVIPRC